MLAALARQSIASDRVELVVVENGTPDGTSELVQWFSAQHPGMRIIYDWLPEANVSAAVNRALDLATYEYITFVDDDDDLAPSYLEALLQEATPDAVTVSWIADIDPAEGVARYGNYVSRALSRVAGETVHPSVVPQALALNVCKLVARNHTHQYRWDTSLLSGMDVLFWTELVNGESLNLKILEPAARAVYYRHVRSGSHSRPLDRPFEYGVLAKLTVIERLAEISRNPDAWASDVARRHVSGQVRHIANYLHENPSLHRSAIEAVTASSVRDLVSWPELNRGRARDLVVSYCFPPTADSSAVVAARRVYKEGRCVDVVSHSMPRVRSTDPAVATVLAPFVGEHWRLNTPVTTLNWSGGVRQFVIEGWSKLEDHTEDGWPYERMYSRAMWPASHLLAALVKIKRPATRWVAEMSDPLAYNTVGELRVGDLQRDDLAMEFIDELRARDLPVLDDDNLARWIEHLTYSLADEVVFTNANQLEYMLEHAPAAGMHELVRSKAVVDGHPVPAEEWFDVEPPQLLAATERKRIGYFGTFYANRGLDEVLASFAELDGSNRDALSLEVFTTNGAELIARVREYGLDDVVSVHPALPYLKYLATARVLDVLLVNDTEATKHHGLNPYLPSKVADYLGTGRPIWGICEPGSPLSAIPVDYRSSVGDAASITAVLRAIASGSKSAMRSPIPSRSASAATVRAEASPSP